MLGVVLFGSLKGMEPIIAGVVLVSLNGNWPVAEGVMLLGVGLGLLDVAGTDKLSGDVLTDCVVPNGVKGFLELGIKGCSDVGVFGTIEEVMIGVTRLELTKGSEVRFDIVFIVFVKLMLVEGPVVGLPGSMEEILCGTRVLELEEN